MGAIRSFSTIATMTGCELRASRSSKHPVVGVAQPDAGRDLDLDSRLVRGAGVAPGVWPPNHQSNDPLIESALRPTHGQLQVVFNSHLESIEGDALPRRDR